MKKLGEFKIGGLPAKKEANREVALDNDEIREAADWLASRTPLEVDKNAVARLTKVFGGPLAMRVETRFSETDSHQIIVGMERPEGVTEQQIVSAVRTLTLLEQPCDGDVLTNALRDLRFKSVENDKLNAEDKAYKIQLYRRELQNFPADAALHAIKRPWKWFPSLPDLAKVAEDNSIKRKSMLKIVKSWKPWDETDLIEKLKAEFQDQQFDVRYYHYTFPHKAEEAKSRLEAVQAKLDDLGVDMTDKVTDEELDAQIKAHEDLNGKDEELVPETDKEKEIRIAKLKKEMDLKS